MEIWENVPVEGSENWEVSNLGNIRHKRRLKNLKFKPLRGYLTINLGNSKRKNKRSFLVHRLVALAFLPVEEGKDIVNHINGIKDDNRVENLEWCTSQYNREHYFSNHHQYRAVRNYLPLNRLRKIYNDKEWNSAEEFMEELEKVANISYKKNTIIAKSGIAALF